MPRFILRFVLLGLTAILTLSPPTHSVWAQAPEKAEPAIEESAQDTYKELTIFADVLERTRSDYVDEVSDKKLIENAINGMLTSLDPHSGFMDEKAYKEMQTQTKGEFGGLGIEVTMEDNIVKVISPIDDTPAAKAGIQPNDLITHLDSNPVTEMTLTEAVDKMRGTPGTKITLTIRRGGITGQPFDVTITRAVIHVQAVRWEEKGSVAYIRIKTFNEQTKPGLDKALEEIGKKMGLKVTGFVIDLRNDPGGLLDQAIAVAGTFLEDGKEVVSTRSRHAEDNQVFFSEGGDNAAGKPIVVLINGGSASASEIVAGALQDHRRAVVMGTRSFGKGSVQTIIPITGSGAMRLTTARYYTPSGRSIQQKGIEPDIEVQPAKIEEIDAGQGIREADLRGALKNDTQKVPEDKKKIDKGKEGDEKKDAEEKPHDYQLERALDLIQGIYLFENKTESKPEIKPDSDGGQKK